MGGYDRSSRHAAANDGAASSSSSRSPGKRTRTEALRRPKARNPEVEEDRRAVEVGERQYVVPHPAVEWVSRSPNYVHLRLWGFGVEVSRLRSDHIAAVTELAASLRLGSNVVVYGHASGSGSEKDNMGLSNVRAREAATLIGRTSRVPVPTMKSFPLGEGSPLVPNDTAENMARNRRVEIYVKMPPVAPVAPPVHEPYMPTPQRQQQPQQQQPKAAPGVSPSPSRERGTWEECHALSNTLRKLEDDREGYALSVKSPAVGGTPGGPKDGGERLVMGRMTGDGAIGGQMDREACWHTRGSDHWDECQSPPSMGGYSGIEANHRFGMDYERQKPYLENRLRELGCPGAPSEGGGWCDVLPDGFPGCDGGDYEQPDDLRGLSYGSGPPRAY